MKKTPIKILHLEDNPIDSELIRSTLETSGIPCLVRLVQTKEEFLEELDSRQFDIVFADYNLPSFDGLSALQIFRDRYEEAPFIFISGSLVEDAAIETLKKGATDYVLKDKLSRLVPSIERAFREREEHKERLRIEGVLLQSELSFRQIFENNPLPMWVYERPSLRFLEVNNSAMVHYGYSRDEFLQMSITDIRPYEDIPTLIDYIHGQSALRHAPWRHRLKDGAVIDVEITSHDLLFHGKEATLVMANDITVRKKGEDDLKRSRAGLVAAQRIGRVGSWEADLIRDTLVWSHETYRIFGQNPETFVPTNEAFFASVHPEDATRVREASANATASGSTYEVQHRIVWPDGSIRHVLESAEIQRSAEGVAVAMIGTVQDITLQKESEDRIREQAALLDVTHDAIYVRDPIDRIIFWNKGAERLYGWTAEEVMGKTLIEEMFRKNIDLYNQSRSWAFEKGEWLGESTQYRKDGTEILVMTRHNLLLDAAGRPKSVLTVNTDITEKKKVEMQFLRSQRFESLGSLASGIVHDLNNMFSAVMMSSYLLKKNLQDPQAVSLLETIELTIQRGEDMAKQILTFTRGSSGEKKLIEPGKVIADALRIIKESFPKTIQVNSEIPEGLWKFDADPTQLIQVLMNLGVNARDAMPKGGRLTIRAFNKILMTQDVRAYAGASPGPHLVISVTDAGTGMPPEIIEKIFDPFFTTKEEKGTGLGLSTVLGIVKGHGGFVSVESSQGHGTMFTLHFPTKHAESAVQDDISHEENGMILVVDEETGILEFTRVALESYGFKVITACSTEDALTQCAKQSGRIPVIVLDVSPEIKVETLDRFTEIISEVRFIVSTTSSEYNRSIRARYPTAIFLQKPYAAEELVQAVQQMLGSV